MKLSALITALKPAPGDLSSAPDPDITSIHYHAGTVRPGGLFVAMAGRQADGHDYIQAAVAQGAAAVVSRRQVDCPVPVIVTGNTRVALARIAARFYGHPAASLVLIGLTGTNGKTTTAYIIESILARAGFTVGVIGTIEYRYAGRTFDNPMTTPESSDLQRILGKMRSAGITHVVMEVSSHALDLERVHGCLFAAAVFTNLTRDHLDYHQDLESYWACKQRLFTRHLGTGTSRAPAAIINKDDPKSGDLIRKLQARNPAAVILTAGTGSAADIYPRDYVSTGAGLSAELATPEGPVSLRSALVGRHNLENLMAAAGVGLYLKVPLEKIVAGIEALPAVPGRLERVPNDLDRHVFVDYAHTPDALENVLQALGRLRETRLICVFGCGGDRDRTKRPLMGALAGRLADFTIVTSDNPRTEKPEAIIAEILTGELSSGSQRFDLSDLEGGAPRNGYTVVPDRRRAIELAIKISRAGDIVLIAGKGHETYQILGNEKIDFDDRAVAAAALDSFGRHNSPAAARQSAPPTGGPTLSWSVADILTAADGELAAGDLQVVGTGLSIDSRTILANDFFIALCGENHDGHRFIEDVLEKGIRGVIIQADRLAELATLKARYPATAWITVADTTRALGALGAYHRKRTGVPVVAITGSNGKTSTRDMTAAVLSQKFSVLATSGNYNNAIGLPLTLLRLTPDHDWAVVELGMNHFGEIEYLAKICEPAVGVITNIGPAHLEFLGSLEGVKRAKGELLEALTDKGLAILNGDDSRCRQLAETCPCPVELFGFTKKAGIHAANVDLQAEGLTFELVLPDSQHSVRMNVSGRFMVANALAAAGVGHSLGLSADQIKTGLSSFSPVAGRMNVKRTRTDLNIMDDTYNANPGSMAVAIETLAQKAGRQARFLVLGNMAELGTQAAELHFELGCKAAGADPNRLYIVGENAKAVAAGATDSGLAATRIFIGSHAEIMADLEKNVRAGSWVLVKGSRSMHMETIVAGLLKGSPGPDHPAAATT